VTIEITQDSLFGGAVKFWQPARGYRVNIDALLLATFAARGRPSAYSVDLGSGVGAITLALHYLGATEQAALIECDPELADLARRNVESAGLDVRIELADLALDGLPDALLGKADLVVSNPPFFEPESARAAIHPQTARARAGRLEPFLAAARAALSGTRARACFTYPARSIAHLFERAMQNNLVAKRLRMVHPTIDQPARLCLVELRRSKPGGLIVEPPLVEWATPGVRTPELDALCKPHR